MAVIQQILFSRLAFGSSNIQEPDGKEEFAGVALSFAVMTFRRVTTVTPVPFFYGPTSNEGPKMVRSCLMGLFL